MFASRTQKLKYDPFFNSSLDITYFEKLWNFKYRFPHYYLKSFPFSDMSISLPGFLEQTIFSTRTDASRMQGR